MSCPSQLLNLKWRGVVGTPDVLAKSERSVATLGTQYLWPASEVGDGLVGLSASLVGSDSKPGSLV